MKSYTNNCSEMNEAAYKYLEFCNEIKSKPDASLVISLGSGWETIIADASYSLYPLLLLLDQLRKKEIKIDLFKLTNTTKSKYLLDANCKVLSEMLKRENFQVEELNLGFLELSSRCVRVLSEGIKENKHLKSVSFRNNRSAKEGLSDDFSILNICSCESLQEINIAENHLDFFVVKQFKTLRQKEDKLTELQPLNVIDYGNYVFEEILNSLTHGTGAVLSLAGSIVLIYNSIDQTKDRLVFYSSLIYSFTLVFLFSASGLYHSSFSSKGLSKALHLVDHSAIYLLIAGTYTPFCLVSLQDHWSGTWMFIVEWSFAFFGVCLTLLKEKVSIPFFSVLELFLYLAMGHMLYLVWEDVTTENLVPKEAIELLVYGGYAFVFGVLFFLIDKKGVHPGGHVIWHIFVLIGSIFHYFAVLLYVVGLNDLDATKEGNIAVRELLEILHLVAGQKQLSD
eukprot:maker-scaffold_11-snap-gene-3.4-mRNA-1 protein AED:0.00 eAED:0.00 QI:19/1/1/1/1/1/2/823/451